MYILKIYKIAENDLLVYRGAIGLIWRRPFFVHFFLSMLQDEISRFGEPNLKTPLMDSVYETEKQLTTFMSVWSADKKTYIAAKPIGGEGALIYIAVTAHPEIGWDFPDVDNSLHSTTCYDF